jgi:hypothetical protein
MHKDYNEEKGEQADMYSTKVVILLLHHTTDVAVS